MRKKNLLTVLLVALLTLPMILAGCGSGGKDGVLRVAIYLGEYGQVWMSNLARKFEEEKGVKVDIEASANLQAEIPNRLKNGSDDDLFFSHGVSWEKAAVSKQIEPLNDLYEMEVEDGVKFKDRVQADFLDTAKYKDTYYKVPWTNGAGGIVYNKKMFEDNGWAVPTVYSNPNNPTCKASGQEVGLMELCEVILNAGISPFVWSSETYYWDYIVFDWWAQLAGIEKMKEYTKIGSADVFNPTENPGHKEALKAWRDLIALHPEYSMEDSVGKIYTAAQSEFVNGNAAMIPNAQWLEMGMKGNYDESVCQMALMPSPFMEGAKVDESGNRIRVNYSVGAGDSIIIPAKAPNKELAKEFLLFMARKDNIKEFTEKTSGVMLAMDYTGIELAEDATDFMKSVYDINTNSVKFNLVSSSRLVLENNISLDWPIEGVQHYASLVADPTKDIDAMFESSYQAILSKWGEWNE